MTLARQDLNWITFGLFFVSVDTLTDRVTSSGATEEL